MKHGKKDGFIFIYYLYIFIYYLYIFIIYLFSLNNNNKKNMKKHVYKLKPFK